MNDVAELAGVSRQTVSRVLNDHPSVRLATRQRVLDAIEVLGYRRNLSARALVTHRSGVIGVITTSSAHVGPASTTSAIEVAARAAGYATQLTVLDQQDDAGKAFEHLAERAVEGLIIVAPRVWLADSVHAAASVVPVVMVAAARRRIPRVHLAAVDQELGARMVVRHLLDTGRRTIAHLSGPADWFDAAGRARGWRDELADAGLDPGTELVGDWSSRSGYEAGLQLSAGPLPEAVFVSNDQMALGLLRAFSDRGVRVPDDVAVVGFDDLEGTAFYSPSLTTVRQPFTVLGSLAVEVLTDAIAGNDPAETSTIVPTLVVRESSGPGDARVRCPRGEPAAADPARGAVEGPRSGLPRTGASIPVAAEPGSGADRAATRG